MIRLLIVSAVSFLFFSVIHFLGKNKKPCKRAFISVLCGPLCLVIVNVLSSVTGVLIPVTELSLATSVTGGIPGVALLVIMSVLV
ncbi:MAG: pro-sigmaK processing inhibitor BofA family protein [Ruminococcus sp.]|nr:pro-sigmaK processing inhibitor BofA family protein [Ruminococcus sp.]